MAADLTAYVPRLLLQWDERFGSSVHEAIDGTLVFADVSGFTRLSEALARKGGKIGAEQMADVINGLFGELLLLAAARGGEMLKYGGDAMLLFFSGTDHEVRGVRACADMQERLHEIGRVDTGAGVVRLRMSVGVHSGSFDFFVGGSLHRELIVAGPATSVTVEMEAVASATEVLVSKATAMALPSSSIGAVKGGGVLLRRPPAAPMVDAEPLRPQDHAAHFLAARLAEHLASGRSEPEHRLATVSFLQFLDLDRLLTSGQADEAARRVEEVLSLVQRTYHEFGVTFLATDLAGDGGKVMAVSGAPTSNGDDEERMLRASLAVLEAGPALPVRIGVNRGHVFAGDVGPTFRRTYTVLGDVTNTAARVMGTANVGQLCVLQEVLRPVRARVDAVALASFVAKGKRDPLTPWAVSRVANDHAPEVGAGVVVGRSDEIDVVVDRVRAALRGEGAPVEVTGGPGAGKSTLVAVALAAMGDVRVVSASANAMARSQPFGTLGPLLRGAIGLDASETPHDALERLAVLAPQHRQGHSAVVAMLGWTIEQPAEVADMSAQEFLGARDGALAAVMVGLDSELVLVIEDADQMDEAGAAAFRQLAKRTAGKPIALVVTTSTGSPFFPEGGTVLELTPLDFESTRQAARAIAPHLAPDLRNRLVARAEGNPLFLRALLSAAGNGALDDADLPDSVEAVLAARLDALSLADRHLIRSLAVLGQEFDLSLATDLIDDTLPSRLPLLGEFLHGSERVSFRHALHRDVAYQSLPFRRRRELHALVATHLESTDENQVELLAHHWHHAGNFERSWHFCRHAASSAKAKFAYREAATILRHGLDDAGRIALGADDALTEAWRELARLLRWTGDLGGARQAARRARRLTSDAGVYAALCQLEGEMLQSTGRHDLALRWYRRGLEARRTSHGYTGDSTEGGMAEVRLLLSIGAVHRERGRAAMSLKWCEEALELATRLGDDIGCGHAYAALHLAHIDLRTPDRVAHGEAALQRFRARGLAKLEAQVLNNLGMDAHAAGSWDEAIEYYSAARAAQPPGSDAITDAVLALNIGEVLIDQRRFRESEEMLQQSIIDLDAAGSWMAHLARVHLGWAYANVGRLAESDSLFDVAEAAFSRMGAASYVELVRTRRNEAGRLGASIDAETAHSTI